MFNSQIIKSVCAAACLFFSISLSANDLTASTDVRSPAELLGAERTVEHLLLISSKASNQIEAKVVVTKRRQRGNVQDVDFRIEFTGVPLGKEYYECFLDMGMKRDGVNKPSCVDQVMTPDKTGKLTYYFITDTMSPGEWMQLTIRSTDGQIEKTVRFVPFK